MPDVPQQQIPGVYHRRVGDIAVTTISDGYLDGTLDVLRNITAEEARRMLDDRFRPSPGRRTSVNSFLIQAKGRRALVDAGSGTYMGPTAGKQIENLVAAGVAPGTIDTILLTHMHPDHSAGLSDRKTGAAYFPAAELVCHENEIRHWHDDAAMAKADERGRALYFECAREQVAPYKARTRTFRQGEVFPGVTAIPCHGHTPGHTAYLIEAGGERLLIWGDTVHVPEIQVARPEVAMAFDTDNEAAIASRRRVLDMVASERLAVCGMHLHFPGYAYVARFGTGYELVPEFWRFQM